VSNSISRAYLLIEGCSVGYREGKFTCERWTETEMDACHWCARPYNMALVRVPCVVIKAVFGTLVLVILSCVWWYAVHGNTDMFGRARKRFRSCGPLFWPMDVI
jgi:hypothetical protein